jgi:hypothetical protein
LNKLKDTANQTLLDKGKYKAINLSDDENIAGPSHIIETFSDNESSVDSINHYFPKNHNELMTQITGNGDEKFLNESSQLIGEIDSFIKYHDESLFPSDGIKSGMYKVIKSKLIALTILNPIRYKNWLETSDIATNINKFFKLEDGINSIDVQSDTYDEVALATVKEQDV